MVLAKDTLFVAGPPSRATASFLAHEGKKGVALIAVAAADGATLGEYSLGALPVHDGMAVAQGRLFVSLENGVLLCLGGAEPGSGAPALAAWSGSATGPRGKPREPGLAGEWAFDEGAGSVARDSSGLGNDAEVNGEWVKTGTGACVFTNGAPAAITIWDNESLHFGTGNFSLALWVKATGYDSRLLGKESFPANWWVINVLADGRAELVLGTGRGPGQSVRPTSKTPLGKQKWTHLAYTVDRKRSVALCYVNGKLDSTTEIPAQFTAALDVAGQNLVIPSAHKPFVGWVDDLTICRRALAAAEVQALRKRHPDGAR
ncbi:LamG domain-containing protein, partial [bacterium]|nr:LamG domain-containing protein [bacterium]